MGLKIADRLGGSISIYVAVAVDLSHAFKVGAFRRKKSTEAAEHPKVERTSSSFVRSGERVNTEEGYSRWNTQCMIF